MTAGASSTATRRTDVRTDHDRTSADDAAFSDGKAGFSVKVGDETIPYEVFGVFVMPSETVNITAALDGGGPAAELTAGAGSIRRIGPAAWTWTAPETSGLLELVVGPSDGHEKIRLNVFVMVPFDHTSETLNGYRIGHYEEKPLRGERAWIRPDGFIEVTPEILDTPVSPHFTIGQFLCKQAGEFPKYVVVRERLLLKLEMLLQQVNGMGYRTNTLHVMSGFRTPWYNRAIGNTTTYSQHLYGSAADVYVDADDDSYMDDLTGDDAVTRGDAVRMASIIETHRNEDWYRPFIGGLGIYSPASHRGPFIHVDVRGSLARW
jgi:hypothetical protein